MRTGTVLFLILISLFWSSCRKNQKEKLSQLLAENIFDNDQLSSAIASEWKKTERYAFSDTLNDWYFQRNFESVWVIHLADSAYAASLLHFFEDLKYEGLLPERYNYEELKALLPRINRFIASDSLYTYLAQAECLLSSGMMLAQKDHYSGMTNPVQLFGSSYGLPLKPELPPNCFDILHPRLYREAYQKSRPQEADYDSLCEYLKYLHDEGIHEPVESVFDFTSAGRIEPGDSILFMPRIARRLYEMKYMKARDTALASPYFYNHAMLSYIKQFQYDRGLQNDGIIGANTLIYLNFTRVKLQMEAMANLERIRWLHIDTSVHLYLRVNLPEFRLFMHYPDSVHSMKVCIGKQNSTDYDKRYAHYLKTKKWQDKPRNFETPQIYSRISHLVLNPTWTVPNSIVAREMYPHMIKDPYYLKKNNYIVLYKDKVYPNPENIRWYKYKANALPFKFVQESGDDNALGKIKFIFPNPYNIYLHDTPLKSKFNQNERSVSHGCVRVQDPLSLALFTSIQMDQYDFDDMRILMGYLPLDSARAANYDPLDSNARIKPATQTVSIFLHRRIPIYFDYRTMYWDEKGTFWWRNDVYRKNHVIIEAILRSGFKDNRIG